MTTEIRVPAVGESVTEVTVARWLKQVGDSVAIDDPLVELETDKATQELPAAISGRLAEIVAKEGSNVPVGGLLARIEEGAVRPAPVRPAAAPSILKSQLRAAPRRRECPQA